ncbi:MAG: AAA family ATPase [Bacteroidota bacterium]
MLTSLDIKNYRNLKNLEIEKLARVNLITGKNNTGKTSLLEAVSLYVGRGSIVSIDELLRKRGEFFSGLDNDLKNNLQSYVSLFNNPNREINISQDYELKIEVFLEPQAPENETFPSKKALNIKIQFQEKDPPALLIITFSDASPREHNMSKINRDNDFLFRDQWKGLPPKHAFVRTFHTEEELARLWDNIASTYKEKQLVAALKLIDSEVESLDFIKDESKLDGRKAVVKIGNSRLPLKSMGDGMNRILTIFLPLVNIDKESGGYLLIDEFENGLHYTVQEELWRMIFKLAKDLNVQVFATTHSNDCIRAFENVLNDSNQSEGQYFRLEKFSDPAFGEAIKPIFYSSSDLEAAIDQNIETR